MTEILVIGIVGVTACLMGIGFAERERNKENKRLLRNFRMDLENQKEEWLLKESRRKEQKHYEA
jgi:hypothetical protein